MPVIGVPCGVKCILLFLAKSPRSAGEIAAMYFKGKVRDFIHAEIIDANKGAFSEGLLITNLEGISKSLRLILSFKGVRYSQILLVRNINRLQLLNKC